MPIESDNEMAGTQENDQPHHTEQPMLMPLPRHLTFAAVVDIHNREIEITDMMVQRACREMEQYEQFPFAPKK